MAVSWKYSDENVPQAWAAEGNQSQVSRLLRETSSRQRHLDFPSWEEKLSFYAPILATPLAADLRQDRAVWILANLPFPSRRVSLELEPSPQGG